jgi:metal-responsive CopG/Arc/MetJ family transcriptional regulator
MKTISLKIPDDVYEKVEKYRKSMDKNRSSYVMEAVVEYTRNLEREELADKLRKEAITTSKEYKEYKEEIEEWDVTLMDGLSDDDWPEYNTKEFLEILKKKEDK